MRAAALALPLVAAIGLGTIGALVVAWAASGIGPIAASAPSSRIDHARCPRPSSSARSRCSSPGRRRHARCAHPCGPHPLRRATRSTADRHADLGARARTRPAGRDLRVPAGRLRRGQPWPSPRSRPRWSSARAWCGSSTRPSERVAVRAAAVVNAGYGPGRGRGDPHDPRPARGRGVRVASLSVRIESDGTTVPTIAARRLRGRLPGAGGAGRAARRTGRARARRTHRRRARRGDRRSVTVTSTYGSGSRSSSRHRGAPAIGPLESDRTSLGTGAYLPAPLLEAMGRGRGRGVGAVRRRVRRRVRRLRGHGPRRGRSTPTTSSPISPTRSTPGTRSPRHRSRSRPRPPATVVDVAAARGVPSSSPGRSPWRWSPASPQVSRRVRGRAGTSSLSFAPSGHRLARSGARCACTP